jgi:hypothetical protein
LLSKVTDAENCSTLGGQVIAAEHWSISADHHKLPKIILFLVETGESNLYFWLIIFGTQIPLKIDYFRWVSLIFGLTTEKCSVSVVHIMPHGMRLHC